MDRYNYKGNDGRETVARFCRCGHAAIIAAHSSGDLTEFEEEWDNSHSGHGHGLVDFDDWLDLVMTPRGAVVAT